MARDRRAIDMQMVFSRLVEGCQLPVGHPLGNVELMKRLIEDTCPGLTANNVDPAFRCDTIENATILDQLLFTCLRAVTLFHFGRLANSAPDSDEFRGEVILCVRGQFVGGVHARFMSMQGCLDELSQAQSVARHIRRLWNVFNKELNAKLPGESRLPEPKPMPDSTVFKGLTTTTFAKYQDAELIWLYNSIRRSAIALSLPFPDRIPSLGPLGERTSEKVSQAGASEVQTVAGTLPPPPEAPPAQEPAGDGVKASEAGDGTPIASPPEAPPIQEPASDAVKKPEAGDGVSVASPPEAPPVQEPASDAVKEPEAGDGAPAASPPEAPPILEPASDAVKESEAGDGAPAASPPEAPLAQEPTSATVKESEAYDGVPVASPPEEPPIQEPASDAVKKLEVHPVQEPVSDVVKVSEEDRVLGVLRDFVAESKFLPLAFHPAALELAAQHFRGRLPLQLLRQLPGNVTFPLDLFIEPSIRRVTFSADKIAFADDKVHSLNDIMALPQSIVLGVPGSGKHSLLMRLAYLINTRPPNGMEPSLMILINAVEYATQAASQWLPAYIAQKFQSAGCLRDLSMNELAMHLEKFHKTGKLCWGASQVDLLGDKLEAIAFQIRQSNCYIIALDVANQTAVQKVRAAFGDPNDTFLIQPFDRDQIHRYCSNYAESACDGFELVFALQDTRTYPNLSALPLGLACICAVRSNFMRLQNAVYLYMAERFCRAGLEPDVKLAYSLERQPVMRALCDIAVGYWNATQSLELTKPMTQELVEQWLTSRSDATATREILSSVCATRLILSSHSGEQLYFALPEVYHLLLATGYLDWYERMSDSAIYDWQFEQRFGRELPPEIVTLGARLAESRCRFSGLLEGDG